MKNVKDEAQMSIEERLAVIEVTNEHINRTLIDMKQDMNRNFDKVEQKFAAVDQRFISLEQSIDQQFTAVDRKFDALQNRMWINFIWIMGGFIGLAGLIAKSQHWF